MTIEQLAIMDSEERQLTQSDSLPELYLAETEYWNSFTREDTYPHDHISARSLFT
jgi:hypothetical protein